MTDLRESTIRLAHEDESLRPILLPLLAQREAKTAALSKEEAKAMSGPYMKAMIDTYQGLIDLTGPMRAMKADNGGHDEFLRENAPLLLDPKAKQMFGRFLAQLRKNYGLKPYQSYLPEKIKNYDGVSKAQRVVQRLIMDLKVVNDLGPKLDSSGWGSWTWTSKLSPKLHTDAEKAKRALKSLY